MIIFDSTMNPTPSTATALASNRRKLRLAGRNAPHVNTYDHQHQQRADEHASPSSASQSSTLSPAARRRFMRAQPNQNRNQQLQASQDVRRRQPQHLEDDYTEQQQHNQSLSQLNLHCTDSVDSDDNGTCFNSIGTTTPRHPPTTSPPRKYDSQQPHLHHDLRLPSSNEFDKSSSWNLLPSENRLFDRNNTSKLSPLAEVSPSPYNKSIVAPKQEKESVWESSRYSVNRSDNNSAYSEFEHWSVTENGSQYASQTHTNGRMKQQQQQRRGRSRTSRYERDRNDASSMASSVVGSSVVRDQDESYHNFSERSHGGTGCSAVHREAENLGENDEVDEFLSRPHVKAAIGVGAAATLCCE